MGLQSRKVWGNIYAIWARNSGLRNHDSGVIMFVRRYVTIWNGDLVDSMVIDTQAEAPAIVFRHDEHGGGARGLQGSDSTHVGHLEPFMEFLETGQGLLQGCSRHPGDTRNQSLLHEVRSHCSPTPPN